MKFTVTFDVPCDEHAFWFEVVAATLTVLREVSDEIEESGCADNNVRDINGNRIGNWGFDVTKP